MKSSTLYIEHILQPLGEKATNCANCQEAQCLFVLVWFGAMPYGCLVVQKPVSQLDEGEVCSVGLPFCLGKVSFCNLLQESESSAV